MYSVFPLLLFTLATLFLSLLTSVSASPTPLTPLEYIQRHPNNPHYTPRQSPPASYNSTTATAALIAACAPDPFGISQFRTFSGSATVNPYISFLLTTDDGEGEDEEEGAPRMTTTECFAEVEGVNATLVGGTGIGNGGAGEVIGEGWACQAGNYEYSFAYPETGLLVIVQSIICDAIFPGAGAWAIAGGSIDLYTVNSSSSSSSSDGGVYSYSVADTVNLTVTDVVASIPQQVGWLPACGQTCATTLLTNSPSSGCASNNATCLCAHTTSFADDLRNCLVETCQSGEEVQEASDYVNLFCVEYGEGGESPTPSVEGGGDGEGTQGGGGDEGEVEG